jgi:hypothetical protein
VKIQFSDCKIVQAKVSDALKKKAQAMCPCNAEVWWDALEEIGIQTSHSAWCWVAGDWDRDGFLRITDPVGVHFPLESCHRHGVLYVPYDLAEKILALGGLP